MLNLAIIDAVRVLAVPDAHQFRALAVIDHQVTLELR